MYRSGYLAVQILNGKHSIRVCKDRYEYIICSIASKDGPSTVIQRLHQLNVIIITEERAFHLNSVKRFWREYAPVNKFVHEVNTLQKKLNKTWVSSTGKRTNHLHCNVSNSTLNVTFSKRFHVFPLYTILRTFHAQPLNRIGFSSGTWNYFHLTETAHCCTQNEVNVKQLKFY